MVAAPRPDPAHRHLPRAPGALGVKRKSVALYKGSLCDRGDVIPLAFTGFMRCPTAHRSAVKLVTNIATSMKWDMRS